MQIGKWGEQVRRGIEGLLGLPILRSLKSSLATYAQQRRTSAAAPTDSTVKKVEADIAAISESIVSQQARFDEAAAVLPGLTTEIDELTQTIGGRGEGTTAMVGKLMQAEQRHRDEVQRAMDALLALIQEDVALAVAGPELRNRTRERLEAEAKRERWEAGRNEGAQNLDRFALELGCRVEAIDPPLDEGRRLAVVEAAKEAWDALWHPAPAGCAENYRHLSLNGPMRDRAIERLLSLDNHTEGEIAGQEERFRIAVERAEAVKREWQELESTAPEVERLTTRLKELSEQTGRYKAQRDEAHRAIQGKEAELAQKRAELGRYMSRQGASAPALRRAGYADRYGDLIQDLLKDALPSEVGEVAEEMTRAWKAMAHLSDRVDRIEITADCEVKMLTADGEDLHAIDKSRRREPSVHPGSHYSNNESQRPNFPVRRRYTIGSTEPCSENWRPDDVYGPAGPSDPSIHRRRGRRRQARCHQNALGRGLRTKGPKRQRYCRNECSQTRSGENIAMVVGISDLATSTFRTTRIADDICADLTAKLGWKHRYVAARLAVGRSLSLPEQPHELTDEDSEDMAIPLRGMQLFGEDAQASAWLALITQHSNETEVTKRVLHGLVTRHWHRGAHLLRQDWEDGGQQMEGFVARLAELASFAGDGDRRDDTLPVRSAPTYTGEVRLAVGEIARDLRSDEHVTFSLNGAGGSPHIAIMGGVGSGKTRTAVHMLRTLRQHCELPLLAFDFKGDLTNSFTESFGATLIAPPEMPIPLDVLHVTARDDTSIKTAAARIRDSISAVKARKPSGVQSEALREAVASVLRHGSTATPANLPDIASALESEYSDRGRKSDELTATLNELTQFSLFKSDLSPTEFFCKKLDYPASTRRIDRNEAVDHQPNP